MLPADRQNKAPADSAAGPARRATGVEDPKRSFLRLVSHELRTPLNSILGFSEILATELYGPLGAPQYRQYAEIIRSSGEKLLKLVNQVVEISRLQAGDIDFDLQAEPLQPIFEKLSEGLQESLTARRLRLVLEPCPAIEPMIDGRALSNVLSNLLQNAIAFSPDGGAISIRAEAVGDQMLIVVSNEGEGVDADDLPRLLRPFEQGESALTRQGEGAGLGLAICDLTCKAMGGGLRLESERGRGFAVHIALPLA